jgi:hypothetical protein
MCADLIDPSLLMGKSKGSSLKSALVHFKNYLIYSKHSKLSLDALDESEITREFMGKFACYLMQCVPSIKKYSTSDNYFSAIHVALELKYPVKMASLSKAYKALRESMFSKYRKESVESGVKFVEGAPIMTSRDLSYICRKCLMDQNFELRCFFLMDKFGVGRCTEVSSILLASFHSLLIHLMLRVQIYYGATSKNTRMMMKMLSAYASSGFVRRQEL